MPYAINHIHIKADDPSKTAAWFVQAFNFTVVSDAVRAGGVRFIACDSETGFRVNISGAPEGQMLPRGTAEEHEGLEHFGFDSDNLEKDIDRLEALGAKLVLGPIQGPVSRVCFFEVPGHVRIELIERPV